MSEKYNLLIDGELVGTARSTPVVDPATGEVFARAPLAEQPELDRAVAAAQAAFPAWAADEELRRKVLARAADVLSANAPEIGRLITLEQGRPIAGAVGEVHGAAGIIRYYAGFRVEDDTLLATSERAVRVIRRPLGVVAGIAPWNVPVLLLFRDIAPALLAGNTVVAKPSEFTPLATLYLGWLLHDVFPKGVFNIITGGKDLGAALSRHPDVAKVTFTGSVAAGKAILQQTADDIKRVSLELGGNDAAIVLADASVAAVADGIITSAFQNAGQICFAIKRLYVHRAIFDELVAALAERARNLRTGHGLDPETTLGPISNRLQYDRLLAIVADARERGAVFHSGGEPVTGPGNFYPATIVTGAGPGSRLVDEEQFGPVLPVIPFDNVDDAVAAANASQFGLGGSVWTSDRAEGERLAARLDVGLAWINQHANPFPGAPSGGHKWSGLGHRGGASGYDHYVSLQVLDSVPA